MQKKHWRAVASLCLLLILSGCSGGGNARFIPPVESARDALTEALQAWKEGRTCQAISDVQPTVQPVDSRWQQGQKLVEFEILHELDKEGPKQFQVRIRLDGNAVPQETTYIVVGQDPLFVYWLTDYEQGSKTM